MACSPDPIPEDPDNGQTEQPEDTVQTPSDTTQTEPSDTTEVTDPIPDQDKDDDGKEDENGDDENPPAEPVPATAPVFTIEMEDGWAAVATLTTDRQDGTEANRSRS